MKFAAVRSALFQIHMWVGLVLGALFVAVSLSGSILVYDDKFTDWIAPAPKARTAGQPIPLTIMAEYVRQVVQAEEGGQIQFLLPAEPRDTVVVRLEGKHRKVPASLEEPVNLQLNVDPVSGVTLDVRRDGRLPVFQWLHQFHGSLKLGRDFGRPLVGWLGVGMVLLGATGIVLWWPKRGQWKYAFLVRRTATGLRFHRELHAAAGIWMFVAFMAVSFSGVAISFPATMRAMVGANTPAPAPVVETVPGGKRLGPDHAVMIARKAMPGATVRGVTVPAEADRPLTATVASRFGTNATVYIHPNTGTVLEVRDVANNGGGDTFMALQRPLHDGQGNLGWLWEFLVFLSGLVPLLFVITGTIMWLKKRKQRILMSAMTDDVVPAD
ncbi:MAG: putative PepSY-associated helix domain [Pseudomonadota bacterium]|jgi:uncharacterized iron-regulated membrane protein